MGKLDAFMKPSNPPSEEVHAALRGKTVQLIGLIHTEVDHRPALQNIVVTLKNGKVVDVELMDPARDESTAINDATGWIDTQYWREWK